MLSALCAAPELGEESGSPQIRVRGGLPAEVGVEAAVQGGEDQATLLCITQGAGRPSVSSPARGLSSPQGDVGTRHPGAPSGLSSTGIWNEDCRRAQPHDALLWRCSRRPSCPSLWLAKGRCRPHSCLHCTGFRISHLYAGCSPVPEPQPGLAEADQSISLHRSK